MGVLTGLKKSEVREKLKRDTEAFLASGGKITKLEKPKLSTLTQALVVIEEIISFSNQRRIRGLKNLNRVKKVGESITVFKYNNNIYAIRFIKFAIKTGKLYCNVNVSINGNPAGIRTLRNIFYRHRTRTVSNQIH